MNAVKKVKISAWPFAIETNEEVKAIRADSPV